ncbi:unnamed protein product [Moneuplotes crassus]|uniref:Uncharacterized protein n=1 Tax=Euplotes crassus TaxID=5936 RepID=A0AAD1UAP6_EUPCR|nr:unnamed protein product [Moneuplotes crassus]
MNRTCFSRWEKGQKSLYKVFKKVRVQKPSFGNNRCVDITQQLSQYSHDGEDNDCDQLPIRTPASFQERALQRGANHACLFKYEREFMTEEQLRREARRLLREEQKKRSKGKPNRQGREKEDNSYSYQDEQEKSGNRKTAYFGLGSSASKSKSLARDSRAKEPNPDKRRVKSTDPNLEKEESEERPSASCKKENYGKWVYLRNKARYGSKSVDKYQLTKEQKEELLDEMDQKRKTRWKPDSHLRSEYGKPIFHPYGKANTNPTSGGIIYGDYLRTHNIHPHSGENHPEYRQTYTSAHDTAFVNGKPTLHPTKELKKEPKITKKEIEELKNKNSLLPDKPSRHLKREVKQLDLMDEVRFASQHDTPAPSEYATTERSSSRKSQMKSQSRETSSRLKDMKRRPASAKPRMEYKEKKAQNNPDLGNISVSYPKKSKGNKTRDECVNTKDQVNHKNSKLANKLAKDRRYKGEEAYPMANATFDQTMASTGDYTQLQNFQKRAQSAKNRAPADYQRYLKYQESKNDINHICTCSLRDPTILPVGYSFLFSHDELADPPLYDRDSRGCVIVPESYARKHHL